MSRGDRWRRVALDSGGSIALLSRVDVTRLSADDLRFVARILDMIGSYQQSQIERRRRRAELDGAMARWG